MRRESIPRKCSYGARGYNSTEFSCMAKRSYGHGDGETGLFAKDRSWEFTLKGGESHAMQVGRRLSRIA